MLHCQVDMYVQLAYMQQLDVSGLPGASWVVFSAWHGLQVCGSWYQSGQAVQSGCIVGWCKCGRSLSEVCVDTGVCNGVHDHRGAIGLCCVYQLTRECVWCEYMSYVQWYIGLAVLNGTVSGGCGAVSVFSLIPACYARVVVSSGPVVSSKRPPALVMP